MRLILPTDFSENAFQAAVYTARLLGVKDTGYTLLHTWFDPDPSVGTWARVGTGLHQAAMDGMRAWEMRVREADAFAGADIQAEVIHGPCTKVVEALAKERKADLVAMASLGQTGLGFLGSNAAAMVRNGHVPVLVVPAKAHLGGMARILFADDRRGASSAELGLLLHLARLTGAEIVVAHVGRDGTGAESRLDEAVFGGVAHRHVQAEGKDVASVLDGMAVDEKAGMIAVLHRDKGFLEGLFHGSTSKQMALQAGLPLLVLQEAAR